MQPKWWSKATTYDDENIWYEARLLLPIEEIPNISFAKEKATFVMIENCFKSLTS